MPVTDARAARERKQKIFVVVGGIVLLALVAFQLPRYLGGGSEASPTTTTAAPETPAPGSSPAPGNVPVALVDTDRPLPAGRSKLGSLAGFALKDPFVQQIKPAKTGSGGSEPGETGFTVGGKPVAAVTIVSVNGIRQALVPGATFPTGNPVFVLVGEQPAKKTVTIAVAGGEYENGARATRLQLGKPLVLVNTTTGARYRLVLVAVGDGEAEGETPTATK
jgi:hypothetical protein